MKWRLYYLNPVDSEMPRINRRNDYVNEPFADATESLAQARRLWPKSECWLQPADTEPALKGDETKIAWRAHYLHKETGGRSQGVGTNDSREVAERGLERRLLHMPGYIGWLQPEAVPEAKCEPTYSMSVDYDNSVGWNLSGLSPSGVRECLSEFIMPAVSLELVVTPEPAKPYERQWHFHAIYRLYAAGFGLYLERQAGKDAFRFFESTSFDDCSKVWTRLAGLPPQDADQEVQVEFDRQQSLK